MKKTFLTAIAGLGLVLFTAPANASFVFNVGGCDFSSDASSGACGGSGADLADDVMTLTFEQNGTDRVTLTIATGQMPTDLGKITDVWFNVTNGQTFQDLSFNHVSGIAADRIIAGGNVPSAGIFDINFEYVSSGPLGAFYYDMTSVYDISASGLLESSFNDLTSAGYAAAMHMNITGSGDSGHYGGFSEPYSEPCPAVPLPPTVLMLASGLAGLLGLRFRKKA